MPEYISAYVFEFWKPKVCEFQMRNFAPQDESVSRSMDDQIRTVFGEDKVIERPTGHLDLGIDRGPLQFRCKLRSLIAAEEGASELVTLTSS